MLFQRLVTLLTLLTITTMIDLKTLTGSQLSVSAELMIPLLDLVSCTDSLVLVQLMRLLHAALVFENSGDEMCWFAHFKASENFVEKFAFMLYNSMSSTLLVNAYEALNSIVNKLAVIEFLPDVDRKDLNFSELFVQAELVSGVVEAFKVMLPEQNIDQSADDSLLSTKSSQRVMNLFLDINVILSQYSSLSRTSYVNCLPDVLHCISRILEPMCNAIYLFPVTSNEQGYIENISEIFQNFGDPFHGGCFTKFIAIRSIIDKHNKTKQTTGHSEWDHEEEEEEEEDIDLNNVNVTILELIARTCKNGSIDDIGKHVKVLEMNIVVDLFKALKAGDSEPDIQETCLKIAGVLTKLWNFDVESIAVDSTS